MSLKDDLTWRYATKKMTGDAVPEEKLQYILDAARLAPSSSGLQPYKVIVITNRELLAKIRAVAFDQSPVTDCSHLLVFAAWDEYSFEKIGEVFQRTCIERGLPENQMLDYQNRLWGMYGPLGKEWHADHAAKQSYIAFAMAIAAAAEQKVDATPMEGFNKEELDKLLGLSEMNLKSVTMLPIGYRDEKNDWLSPMKKVRTPFEEFTFKIN
jgi:nitroreductase/dihydropteridine reductase